MFGLGWIVFGLSVMGERAPGVAGGWVGCCGVCELVSYESVCAPFPFPSFRKRNDGLPHKAQTNPQKNKQNKNKKNKKRFYSLQMLELARLPQVALLAFCALIMMEMGGGKCKC